MSIGIDYGMGKCNVDLKTGIRYGVIPSHRVDLWDEVSEADYGPPTCPECGGKLVDYDDDSHADYHHIGKGSSRSCAEYACTTCEKYLTCVDDIYPESPLHWYVDDSEYTASCAGDDSDIFVTRSPYYTRAAYCSPCAPGAVYLLSPSDEGEKGYCLGHDFFEFGAPYPVYRVSDDTLIPIPEDNY